MSSLRPVEIQNAAAAATDRVRQAILDGRLQPGHRLKEEEVGQELGLSRTPVREALLTLQAEGLVVAAPNRGAVVRSYNAQDLHDTYQLRSLLEGYAARTASERITDEQISVLLESCERFASIAHDDIPTYVAENALFHDAILKASDNARLASIVRSLTQLPLIYQAYFWSTPDQKRMAVHYHRQLVGAFTARDSERAELLMKEHIFGSRDVLIARVRELENQ